MANAMVESTGEILSRLLHQGGYILVVGGGLKDLPDTMTRHPQVLIWDDQTQNWENKIVPSNTRAILTSKFVSHPQRLRLQTFAKSLHVPMWPMLTHREIREALGQIIEKASPTPMKVVEAPASPDVLVPVQVLEEAKLRPIRRGEYDQLIPKYFDKSLTYMNMGKRLVNVLKENHGISVTEIAATQAVSKWARAHKDGAPEVAAAAKPTPPKTDAVPDDFAQAEQMLKDARVAIDLALEAVAALRKSTADVRKRQQKLRELLLD